MKWASDFGFSQSIKISENFFGATILLERHSKEHCTCSYCRDEINIGRLFRLSLPECKASNAWRRVIYVGNKKWYYYLRWTLPSLERWITNIKYSIQRRKWKKTLASTSSGGVMNECQTKTGYKI